MCCFLLMKKNDNSNKSRDKSTRESFHRDASCCFAKARVQPARPKSSFESVVAGRAAQVGQPVFRRITVRPTCCCVVDCCVVMRLSRKAWIKTRQQSNQDEVSPSNALSSARSLRSRHTCRRSLLRDVAGGSSRAT